MAPTAQVSTDRRVWIGEHDAIYDLFQRMGRAADRLREHGTSTRRVRLLVEEIESLQAKLKRHFEREEKEGGLFASLVELMPDEQRTFKRLRQEHAEVMDALGALHAQVSAGGRLDVRQIAADVSRVVDTLFTHETAEERLTERALKWAAPQRS